MKTKSINIKLVIIFLITVFTGCNKDAVVDNLPKEYEVKIISPADGANFAKHEEIKFEAHLLFEGDTIAYDEIHWDFNNDESDYQIPEFKRAFNVGGHQIICSISKENYTFSDTVNISIENKVIVDTIYQTDQIAIFEIPGSEIYSLGVDRNDNVIAGTNNKGLYINKNGSWINYDVTNGLSGNYILDIVKNRDGEIYFSYYWLYQNNNHLSKLTENSFTNIAVDPSINIYQGFYKIAFDMNNNLWAATGDGTVVNYINGAWNSLNTLSNRSVLYHHPSGLMFDSKNILWGSSDHGTVKYDGENWDSVLVNGKRFESLCLAVDKDDNIWLGEANINGGLYKISESDTVYYNYSNSNLLQYAIRDLVFDPQNNLWLGTENGLVKFDGINWVEIQIPFKGAVRNITIDSKGQIWFTMSNWDTGFYAFGFYKN